MSFMKRMHVANTFATALAFLTLLASTNAWAISVSPSPSYTGSFTVSLGHRTGCFDKYFFLGRTSWTCYRLQQKVGSGSWTEIITFTTSEHSFLGIQHTTGITSKSFSGKAVNTYKYRLVRSIEYEYETAMQKLSCGFLCFSSSSVSEGPITVYVKKPTAPPTPTGANTSDSGGYTISWGASTGATSYKLQEKLNSGSWTLIHNASGRSKARSGRGDGVWYYRARGCNSRWCGTWSGTKSVIVALKPGTPGTPLVTPPVSTTASHTVTWSASSGSVTGYEIWRSIDTGTGYGSYQLEDTVTTLSKAYINLADGSYKYKIRAINTVSGFSGEGEYGDPSIAVIVKPPPSFSISASDSAEEGDQLSFTVTKSYQTNVNYSVNFNTVDGSATADEDYESDSQTLTFDSGETDKTIYINTSDDEILESIESFNVVLNTPTGGATITESTWTGEIRPDEDKVYFEINDVQAFEGESLPFTITMFGESALTHTVDFSTGPAEALAGEDYDHTIGTVTFVPGSLPQPISIKTLDEWEVPAIYAEYPNGLYESNETLRVVLSNASNGAWLGADDSGSEGIGQIIDDEDIPFFVVIDANIDESAQEMNIYIQGHKDSEILQSVAYEIQPDTASAGVDYGVVTGRAYFGAGEAGVVTTGDGGLQQTIVIPIVDDAIYEGNETLTISLTEPQGGAIIKTGTVAGYEYITATGVATGTILDDTDIPTFSVTEPPPTTEGNPLNFTIIQTGASALGHQIYYETLDGTETPFATVADNDYIAAEDFLVFPPTVDAVTSQTVPVATQDDVKIEENEDFKFRLSQLSNVPAGTGLFDPVVFGTIENDDFAPGIPASLSVTSDGIYKQHHNVAWGAAESVPENAPLTSYQLERRHDGGAYDIIHTHNPLDPLNYQEIDVPDGSYYYRIQACNVSGCSDWREFGPVQVISIPENLAGTDSEFFKPTTNQYSYLPGFTPGEFNVSSDGGSSYSLPIAVPPGTAGMQPALSLSYNNRTGNALLGKGWTLGGLSVITRCPATIAEDGSIDPIDFDGNDKFCIDGERLVAVSGAYGDDSTEYRTATDGFTKVISYGVAGSGPEKFKVWTKSGQILKYGYNTDSRIEAQGRADGSVRLWAVDRIKDTAGNYLDVSYCEDSTQGSPNVTGTSCTGVPNANGGYAPTRIDYTGHKNINPALDKDPYASVRFKYETRTDTNNLYLSGSRVKATQRLSNIETYVGNELVRDYKISYDNLGAGGRAVYTMFRSVQVLVHVSHRLYLTGKVMAFGQFMTPLCQPCPIGTNTTSLLAIGMVMVELICSCSIKNWVPRKCILPMPMAPIRKPILIPATGGMGKSRNLLKQ